MLVLTMDWRICLLQYLILYIETFALYIYTSENEWKTYVNINLVSIHGLKKDFKLQNKIYKGQCPKAIRLTEAPKLL